MSTIDVQIVQATDSLGRTMLHYASLRRFDKAAGILVRCGCGKVVEDLYGKIAYDYHRYRVGDRVITRDDSLHGGNLGIVKAVHDDGLCSVWLWRLDSLGGLGMPGDGRVVPYATNKLRPGPSDEIQLLGEMIKILNESTPTALSDVRNLFKSAFLVSVLVCLN